MLNPEREDSTGGRREGASKATIPEVKQAAPGEKRCGAWMGVMTNGLRVHGWRQKAREDLKPFPSLQSQCALDTVSSPHPNSVRVPWSPGLGSWATA